MKTRVLIVDDSVVVRRIVSDMIEAEMDLEVAGIAHHGKIALQKIPQVNPDVITLDVDMPEMNGIETLKQIRELYPNIPVLMLSGLTVRSAQLTFDALAMGAADYVAKPTTLGLGGANLDRIREELVAKIRALTINRGGIRFKGEAGHSNRVDILGIGVSTGGPNALGTLLARLPANFPVPIIIVQHIPAQFTTHFVDRLRTKSTLPLEAAVSGALAKPGTIWLAPGDYHVTVTREAEGAVLHLDQNVPMNSCRPSVDATFISMAQQYGPQALGMILTGMGQDGLRGAEAIKEVGGQIIAQDRSSSVIWGMPRAVVEKGLADEIVHLDDLPRVMSRYVARERVWAASGVEEKV